MPYRNIPLVETETYHIFTRSIAGFRVFNSEKDFQRMKEVMVYYTIEDRPCKFSLFLKRKEKFSQPNSKPALEYGCNSIVRIIAYCLMPTHIHLILQQLKDNGISRYLNLILKSYSKYFNIRHNRKGPLWEGRFKNVLIESNRQLLHLSRYVHLNPVTAEIVDKPEEWVYSSYREYIKMVPKEEKICDYQHLFDIEPDRYREFVEDRISYQRELDKIKHLILE